MSKEIEAIDRAIAAIERLEASLHEFSDALEKRERSAVVINHSYQAPLDWKVTGTVTAESIAAFMRKGARLS